jgi:hypothetical protein
MDEEGWQLSGRTSARGAGTLIPAGHARLPRAAAIVIPFRFPVGAAIVLWLQSARNAGLLASAYAVELPGNAR